MIFTIVKKEILCHKIVLEYKTRVESHGRKGKQVRIER